MRKSEVLRILVGGPQAHLSQSASNFDFNRELHFSQTSTSDIAQVFTFELTER